MHIELRDVSFAYRGGSTVLHGINLDLFEPGLVCIIGPNGVGKSTLVKCINRILKPTEGSVWLDGTDMSTMTQKEIAKKIGYVPAHAEDTFSMTVMETILIGRHNKQRWRTTSEDVVKVHRVLEALGMEDLADRRFKELSAGQTQNIAIARGLVQETEVLILDEPTSNLDIKHQMFVTGLLREIAARNNMMVIMISHNLDITAKYADKVILMAEPGVVHSIGTAEEVITKENLKEVYDVDCDIVVHESRPAILLNESLD